MIVIGGEGTGKLPLILAAMPGLLLVFNVIDFIAAGYMAASESALSFQLLISGSLSYLCWCRILLGIVAPIVLLLWGKGQTIGSPLLGVSHGCNAHCSALTSTPFSLIMYKKTDGVMDMAAGMRDRKKKETEQKLFDAAISLFVEKGYANTTIQEIADRADVSKGTLLNYYPYKEDFVLKFGRKQGERLRKFTQTLPPELSVRARIEAIFSEVLKGVHGSTQQAKFQLIEIYKIEGLYASEMGHRNKFAGALTDILKRGQEKGEISPEFDCDHIGSMMVAIYFNAIYQCLAFDTTIDANSYVFKALDILFRGIGL